MTTQVTCHPINNWLREVKSDMMDAAVAQYQRRSCPTAHTGWGPDEIHQFMRFQFHQLKIGQLRRREIGGWRWKLPKRGSEGEPAPLPPDVIEFNRKRASQKVQGAGDERSRSRSRSGRSSESSDNSPRYVLESRRSSFLHVSFNNSRCKINNFKTSG